MSESDLRVVEIFTEALQLPAGERTAFLNQACGNDTELRRHVEALLLAHEQAGDFLESPPAPAEAGASPGEKPGDRIGRYKLLQQIGEGGCGVVYMAEQEEPVRRRVALKIIKAGMDTKSVIARFEAERQALALMDHPNIAKVLDAGATASGRPYFVMELVRGVKITEYCDEHSLTTLERLNLFIQICQAVQHAHQKGIIHRDLKPSNILVTTSLDGTALPVVIDFGIAKATTNQRLTDKTLFTAFEMLIGTPAYMSPEQAVLTSVDVDTRTDIYSLGVLLYELLTSTTPFDAGELMKAGLDEVRRVIREREPVRPSSRLSRMTKDDLTNIAHHRKVEPPKLIGAVHGDLDWIVMKALEKDRTRRYETANGLALDLKRYLANETVSARPPSTLYRLQKTITRHKVLFGAIGAITLFLMASLVVISASLTKERQARKEADAALRQAETDKTKANAEAAKSQQVTRFLEEMLQGVGPSVARGRDTQMLREVLDKAAVRVGTELAGQPAIQLELQNRIGSVYEQLSAFDRAEAMHQAALATARKFFGEDSKEVADSLSYLGRTLFRQNKGAEAEKVYSEALEVQRKVLGEEHLDVAETMKALAGAYYTRQKVAEAEAMNRAALEMRRKLLGDDNLIVADSLNSMAILLEEQSKFAEAEMTHRKVLALRRKLLGVDHPLTTKSLNNLSACLADEYKVAEAEAIAREALAVRLKLFGKDSMEYMQCLYSLSMALRIQGRLVEAESLIREAHDIELKLSGSNEVSWRNANTLSFLAVVWEAQGRWAEAETAARQVFELARKTTLHGEAATRLKPLISVLTAERKFAEAEQLLADFYRVDFPGESPGGEFLALHADYQAHRSRWSVAADDATLALHARPADYNCYDQLAALLVETHEIVKYQELCRTILAKFGSADTAFVVDRLALDCLVLPSTGVDLHRVDQMVANADSLGLDEEHRHYHQVGRALSEYRQNRFTGALTWARQSAEDPSPELQGLSQAVLAMAHQRLGQKDEARDALASAEEARHKLVPPGSDDLGRKWKEWIFVQTLVGEAHATIEPTQVTASERGKPQGRSL